MSVRRNQLHDSPTQLLEMSKERKVMLISDDNESKKSGVCCKYQLQMEFLIFPKKVALPFAHYIVSHFGATYMNGINGDPFLF